MHIESYGRGADVVILNGVRQQPQDLEDLVSALAAARRVHVVHSPGYGREPARLGRHNLDAFEDELRLQLRALAPRGFSVLGVGCGSYRAIRATQRGSWTPRGIIALGPVPLLVETMRDAWRAVVAALEAEADVWPRFVAGLFTHDFSASYPTVPAAYLSQLRAVSRETVADELRALMRDRDRSAQLRDVRCPVYMRVGEQDAHAPHTLALRAMKSLPRARLDVVADVEHLLHHEDREATLRAVLEALQHFESEAGRPVPVEACVPRAAAQ